MKAEENKTRLTEEVLQLKSQLRESQNKRSTLEMTAKKGEEKAQRLEERVGMLQKQYEAQGMATKNALDLTIFQRSELQSLLDDAHSDITKKTKTISSLSSLAQQLQSVAEELEYQKETSIRQSEKIQETLENRSDGIKSTLGSTSDERDKLQHLLDDARRIIAQKSDTIQSLTAQLNESQGAMKVTETRETVTKKTKALEKELADVKRDYERAALDLRLALERANDKDQEMNHLRSSLGTLDNKVDARDCSSAMLQEDHRELIVALRRELNGTKKELSLTKQEVESSRIFNNTGDAVAETGITVKLESLNDCVYQTASIIADTIQDGDLSLSANPLSDKTKWFFGEPLCNLVMETKRNATHPRILASLKACMNQFCANFLSFEFYSIGNPEKTEILQQIYNNIKASR